MANARDMMKNVKHTAILVLMTLMFVVGLTVANPQKAEAGWDAELAFGWDSMILDSGAFETTNNGFVSTLSFGYRFFDLVGLYYEQDFGFIQPETKISNISIKGDKMFKGASLADVRLFIGFLALIELSFKLGVGAMYMDLPDGAEDDWQKWFALRAGVGLAFTFVGFRVGLGFDYTLGAADKNKLDGRDSSHFVSLKGFVGYVF